MGSQVTLLVSRQQVLPIKDPEVAAVLEESFLDVGVKLLKGARADAIARDGDVVRVHCDDGREITGSHVLLAVGSIPNTEGIGLEDVGVEVDERGCIPVNHNCLSNVPSIYAAGDVSGKLPLSSVAAMQGRKIAEHLMGLHNRPHRHLDYDKAASAVFTDPEIADVGLAEAEAFSVGRKIRVTKVPFSSNPKALIKGDARGFVKILSDPATGVVLGGSIVGRNAAELISVIALAVTNGATSPTSSTPSSCTPPWPSPSEAAEALSELSVLLDDDEDVAGADGVAVGDADLGHGARGLGVDVVLHLHRLEHEDGLTGLDGVADRRRAPSRSCPASAR